MEQKEQIDRELQIAQFGGQGVIAGIKPVTNNLLEELEEL